MLKVALDLHGTYDENVDIFNNFIQRFRNNSFYILSGSPVVDIVEHIVQANNWNGSEWSIESETLTETDNELQVMVTPLGKLGLLSICDFCRLDQKLPMNTQPHPKTGKPSWFYSGHESVWWAMKSVICRIHGIDLLVDDNMKYKEYFGTNHPTKFHTWAHVKNPGLSIRVDCLDRKMDSIEEKYRLNNGRKISSSDGTSKKYKSVRMIMPLKRKR